MKFIKGITLLFLLSTLFVGVSAKGFAQGNLQFNQVLTFAGSGQGGITLGTVPINKVWKLEAHTMSSINMYINGYLYNFLFGNSAGLVYNDKPLWLKGGDVLSISTDPACCVNREYVFSILEFNIAP